MSSNLQQLLNEQNEAQAVSGIDMSEAVSGGGGSRMLPAGIAFAQLIEVVELGKQPQEYQGQAKDPVMEIQLAFALTGQCQTPGPNGEFEKYANEDGTPYIIRPYSMAMHRNDKAAAFKLFKALNYKGVAKTFGQLLGQKWLVNVVHVPKSTKDKTLVSRLDLTSFRPAIDPMSGAAYPIPDAPDSYYKAFSWAKPTLAAWDSLFVEGEWAAQEAKDGKPARAAQSKNRVQETILGAVDFEGSPLQALLLANGKPIPVKAAASPVAAPQAVVAPPASPVVAAAPVAAVQAPAVPTVAAQPGAVAAPAVTPAAAVAAPVVAPAVVGEVAAPLAVQAPVVAPPGIAPVAVAAPNVVLPA